MQGQRLISWSAYTVMRNALLVMGCVLLAVEAVHIYRSITVHPFVVISLFLGFAGVAVLLVRRERQEISLRAVRESIALDSAAAVLTSAEGDLLGHNPAARELSVASLPRHLKPLLQEHCAAPEQTIKRLVDAARSRGEACEVFRGRAQHVKLSVQWIENDIYIWRFRDGSSGDPARSFLEALAAPAFALDGTGERIVHANTALRALLGRDPAHLQELLGPDIALRENYTNVVITPAGSRAFIAMEVSRTDHSGLRRFALIDASESDQPNEAAAAAWGAFEDLPVPLLKLSAAGDILLSNRPARELLGFDPREPARVNVLLEGLGRSVTDWLKEAAEGSGPTRPEFLRVSHEEQEIYVQVTLNRLREAGTNRLIAVLHDATELKTLEAQFVQSQKMHAIGELAGGVAHDFNNLLTAISGHCDLLLLRHDQSDPAFSDLMQINQNANRAAALVGQLLAFSRKQMLKPEALDLRDTLSDLTHLLNRLVGERIALRLRHAPEPLAMRADKRQLEQVLMNLVVNARDAMPDGGQVTISTQALTLDAPLERSRVSVLPGEYVVIRVEDQGVGIPPEKRQKIFEPFYTTKRVGEGTGLGLSTVYGIVKQSGGYIFVDGEPGGGTCFTLYFPRHQASPVRVPKAVKPLPADFGAAPDGVILLVEDEAPVRAFASRALRLRGLHVLEAASAEHALEILEDPNLRVDVFVTDVVMPGMDGPGWVREARKTRPNVRVVFVSGYAEDAFGSDSDVIENSVFLPKPFSLSQLTQTVSQQLSEARAEGQPLERRESEAVASLV